MRGVVKREMAYVLTGERGDIGSQIAAQILAAGADVISYQELSDMPENGIFVHMAAKHPVHSVTSQVRSNIDYLQQAIEFARLKARLFVFFSSTSVYGRQSDGIVTESSPICANDTYASTKVIGEELVRNSGLDYLIIRCPAILETVNSYNLLSRLADTLMRNEPVELFNAHRVFNNYTHSNALSYFILKAVETGTINKTVNAAVKPRQTLLSIIEYMARLIGSTSSINNVEKPAPFCQLDCEKFWQLTQTLQTTDTDALSDWIRLRMSNR